MKSYIFLVCLTGFVFSQCLGPEITPVNAVQAPVQCVYRNETVFDTVYLNDDSRLKCQCLLDPSTQQQQCFCLEDTGVGILGPFGWAKSISRAAKAAAAATKRAAEAAAAATKKAAEAAAAAAKKAAESAAATAKKAAEAAAATTRRAASRASAAAQREIVQKATRVAQETKQGVVLASDRLARATILVSERATGVTVKAFLTARQAAIVAGEAAMDAANALETAARDSVAATARVAKEFAELIESISKVACRQTCKCIAKGAYATLAPGLDNSCAISGNTDGFINSFSSLVNKPDGGSACATVASIFPLVSGIDLGLDFVTTGIRDLISGCKLCISKPGSSPQQCLQAIDLSDVVVSSMCSICD